MCLILSSKFSLVENLKVAKPRVTISDVCFLSTETLEGFYFVTKGSVAFLEKEMRPAVLSHWRTSPAQIKTSSCSKQTCTRPSDEGLVLCFLLWDISELLFNSFTNVSFGHLKMTDCLFSTG